MSTAQETSNKATVRRFDDVVSTGDAEVISKTIDELVEPDVLIHMPLPIQATGAQALKQVWAMLLRGLPDLHVAVEDVIAEGTRSSAATRLPGPTRASTGASHQPANPSPPDRFDEEAEMRTQRTKTFQHATDEKSATVARSRWNWSRIRPIAFWATTFVVVFELAAGSVWNLVPIEWVEVQLDHLGYPHFFAYILGAWQVGAAVVIIAPGLPLIKEWAYVGSFFLWSGAVASHLSAGDGVESWWVPLMFATCAIASWVLRPPDRRLPETRLRRDRPADAGQDGAGPPETHPRAWETRPRAWAVPIVLLVVLYAVSFLTLPAIEEPLHERAVELGWIDE